MKNVFFDTCVYHQPGIELLTKVIPIDNILFASEMVGAVQGHRSRDRASFRRHQALRRPARTLGEADRTRSSRAMRGACSAGSMRN